MDTTAPYQVIHWDRTSANRKDKELLGEEPLSVRVQGNPYSVVVRTPGDEIEMVAGFCLTEGIIDSQNDYVSIAFCDGADTNVVAVSLKPSRRDRIAQILDRRGFISQTSCGLCGKEIVNDLFQEIQPLQKTADWALTGPSTGWRTYPAASPCGARPVPRTPLSYMMPNWSRLRRQRMSVDTMRLIR